MPKMKTRKALKLRFRATASGRLKRQRPGRRHILEKKSAKRKAHLRSPAYVSESQEKMYRQLMGV